MDMAAKKSFPKPGRKPSITKSDLKIAFNNWKSKLFYDEEMTKLKSKDDEIWEKFSDAVGKKMQAKTLYSRVCELIKEKPCSLIKNEESESENCEESSDVGNRGMIILKILLYIVPKKIMRNCS